MCMYVLYSSSFVAALRLVEARRQFWKCPLRASELKSNGDSCPNDRPLRPKFPAQFWNLGWWWSTPKSSWAADNWRLASSTRFAKTLLQSTMFGSFWEPKDSNPSSANSEKRFLTSSAQTDDVSTHSVTVHTRAIVASVCMLMATPENKVRKLNLLYIPRLVHFVVLSWNWLYTYPRIILCMRLANERPFCGFVMVST